MTVSTLANICALPLLILLSGCQLPYLVSGAVEQVRILNSRKSISKTIESVAVSDKTKDKLRYAQKAKDFAAKNGLTCKKNFDTFVQLKRPYVSYLVVAAPKNAITPKKWWFPIVGSFPYKGYFSEKKALREIERLKKRNYDTYTRGVSAYSSLGWFKEPILSSMLRYGKQSLAETIFHECFHRTFYLKSATEINEQLAVFIGYHYLLNFLEEQQDFEQAEREKLIWADQEAFTHFLEKTIKESTQYYKDGKTDREELFSKIQSDYKAELKPIVRINNYDKVFLEDLNNAKLVAFKTYFHKFDKLSSVLKNQFNSDIVAFTKHLSSIKKESKKREALKELELI